jgi:hypothetical protein
MINVIVNSKPNDYFWVVGSKINVCPKNNEHNMGRIVIDLSFENYSFSKPKIDLNQYILLKSVLAENPDAIIEPKSKTFIEEFTLHFKFIGGFILLGLVSLIIIFGFDVDDIIGLFILLVVSGIFGALKFLYLLIMEGATYANFLKKKEAYFKYLRVAIIRSDSYDEFQSLHDLIKD